MTTLGKYGRDRTTDVAVKKEVRDKVSIFMLTFNPNEVTYPGDAEGDDVKERLATLGDFILEDRVIKSILTFPGSEEPRPANLDKVFAFSDKKWSLEYGHVNKRIHMHLTVGIRHRTKLLIDKETVLEIARPFFRNPSKLHLNIRGQSGNLPILEYLEKYPVRREEAELIQES